MCRAAVIFAAFVAFAHGQTTLVSRCTRDPGELPINAYIAGCEAPPCTLPQLEDVVINIVFKVPRTTHKMTTKAVAYLSFIGLPVPIPYDLRENAVTCNFLQNSYCPVLQDEILEYTLYMFIESTFPVGTAATIEFRIEDQEDKSIMCIRVPISITAPRDRSSNSTLSVAEDN